MELLIVALHEATMHKMLITMLLMGAVTSLVVLIEPRVARSLVLAAMTLLAAASLFFGHRLAGALLANRGETGVATGAEGMRGRCIELARVGTASRRPRPFDADRADHRHVHFDAHAAVEAARCSGHAVSAEHHAARNGRGSPRQIETAR